jgi:acyl carrier protein
VSKDEHESETCGEIRALIEKVTRRSAAGIAREADLVYELGLDSLAGLRVLAAVEKRFDLRIPDEELSSIRTIDQLLETVDRCGGGAPS